MPVGALFDPPYVEPKKTVMRSLVIALLLGAALMTASCKKEYSPGELIAQDLQEVIRKNKIDRMISFRLDQSWDGTTIFGDYGLDYEFEGQFVVLEGDSYNLNSLIKYQIGTKSQGDSQVQFLLLSFY